MCVPMTAFAAPNTQGIDTSIDYMHEMIRAANDGSPYALHAGAIFERLRNYKIDVLGWGNKYERLHTSICATSHRGVSQSKAKVYG